VNSEDQKRIMLPVALLFAIFDLEFHRYLKEYLTLMEGRTLQAFASCYWKLRRQTKANMYILCNENLCGPYSSLRIVRAGTANKENNYNGPDM
jgi:hypothetical protein